MGRLVGVEFGFDRARNSGAGRERAWQHRYRELVAVVQTLGRLPRSESEVSAGLLAWVTNQRRALYLDPGRQRQLEDIPGWEWDPRGALWVSRAEDLQEFVERFGRTPRVRTANAEERALAHWYSRQKVAERDGELAPERQVLLSYATRHLRA